MAPKTKQRKGGRSYDATGRQARAREQRDAALAHAERLFLEKGYAAATVKAIAKASRVSEATIFKSYGGKAGLIRELCERALRGAGTVPAETRSDALRAGRDARKIAAGWGALAAEVAPRIAPLALVLRAAAQTDREAAALYAELEDIRLRRMADNAQHLADAGLLRRGVSTEQARDVLWMSATPDLYELMVMKRGWSPEQFGELVTNTIIGALL
jgi:AcrR family transcriptional regulator